MKANHPTPLLFADVSDASAALEHYAQALDLEATGLGTTSAEAGSVQAEAGYIRAIRDRYNAALESARQQGPQQERRAHEAFCRELATTEYFLAQMLATKYDANSRYDIYWDETRRQPIWSECTRAEVEALKPSFPAFITRAGTREVVTDLVPRQ